VFDQIGVDTEEDFGYLGSLDILFVDSKWMVVEECEIVKHARFGKWPIPLIYAIKEVWAESVASIRELSVEFECAKHLRRVSDVIILHKVDALLDISQREDFVGEKLVDVVLALTVVIFRFVTSFCLYDIVDGLLFIDVGLLGSLEIYFWVEEVGAKHDFNVVHQIQNLVFLVVEELLGAGSELEILSFSLGFAVN
jgi:hypothetical protein